MLDGVGLKRLRRAKMDEANSPRTATIKAGFHRKKAEEIQSDAIARAGRAAKTKYGPDYWTADSMTDSFGSPEVKKLLRRSDQHRKAAEKADDIAGAHYHGMHGTAMNRWGISRAKEVVDSAKSHLSNRGHSPEDIDGFVASRMARHYVDNMRGNGSHEAHRLDKYFNDYQKAVARENRKR